MDAVAGGAPAGEGPVVVGGGARPPFHHSAGAGLIPTGWYPTAVAARPDGARIWVVNGKSNTGPVPRTCRTNLAITDASQNPCHGANQYVWQLQKAGFLTLPPPSAAVLAALTRQVA